MKSLSLLLTLYSEREKRRLVGMAALMFAGGVLEVAAAGILVPFFLMLKDPGIVLRDYRLAWLYGLLDMTSAKGFVVLASAGVLLFYVIKNAYMAGLAFLQAKFVAAKQYSLTRRLFRAYVFAPYAFHLQHNSAELQNTSILQAFSSIPKLTLSGLSVLSEVMVVAMLLTLLLVVRPLPTLAVTLLICSLALIFFKAVRSRLESLGRVQVRSAEDAIKWLNQAFGGIKETKAFMLEDFFVEALSRTTKERSENQYLFTAIGQMPRFFMETITVGILCVLVILMLLQGYDSDQLLSGLVLFAAAGFRLVPSADRIATNLGSIKYYLPTIEPVCRDLALLEGAESEMHQRQKGADGSERLTLSNAIAFEGVSFTYPGAEVAALDKVSLTIDKGRSVAFVGPSGAGKTTLVDLLLGLFKPVEGRITVDGLDIHEHQFAWRRMVGYVPQAVYLCDDSVRRNIAFGIPDREVDEERLESVVRAAQLQDVVRRMPEGLDTAIGERGVRLSGGERQRLGIARALYRSPDILILDEATSSLDYETEREVTAAVERLKGYVTIIVVAHRLSAVKGCHDIYALRGGRLEGRRSYEDLVRDQSGAETNPVPVQTETIS